MLCFTVAINAQTYQPVKILPNTFFKDSELLTYQLRYGFIIGGKVSLEVRETNSSYHLVGTAVTTGLADKLFSVKDIYESFFLKESGLPVFAIQNVKEGKSYKYYNEVKYNHSDNTVSSTKSGIHEVPVNTLDMMSVFYYIRRMDFTDAKEGDIFKINTYFSDKLFPFELRYKGRETINTDFGKIRCLKFAPIVEPGRVFKSKDDMHIWYTDDENRIPILISMEMLVGHVNCELTSFKNLKKQPVFKK
jgi:hypothetical protein